jgi:murein DD-endopeptidase MepM/ murein hydrolase activator NlpD
VRSATGLLLTLFLALFVAGPLAAQTNPPATPATHAVEPGDTWTALAARFGTDEATLRALNPHLNAARQPVIGGVVNLPAAAAERPGRLARPNDGGLLQAAARAGLAPWTLAAGHGLPSPYRPTLYRPLLLPGDGVIRDFPPGLEALEVSPGPPAAGQALGLRGRVAPDVAEVATRLDVVPAATTLSGERFVALVGTGAFFAGGQPELLIRVDDGPAWTQPWQFTTREWDYQDLTLTGEAAQIDQQARDEERARLRELWSVVSPNAAWNAPFRLPLDNYLHQSATYGGRRSYNGGPYASYHEGVDYSAYAGTPVYAPAAGTVVLAEQLYVRGGAVIIDHGLGVFSGFYHLSAVHVSAGQAVQRGDLLGEVGTTGLSTGNHLHWDLLINGVWVDATVWQEQGMDCWTLEALGRACL